MTIEKLIIKQQDNIYLIDYDHIVFCQSDNCYTFIHTIEDKKFIAVQSLSKFAKEQLKKPAFIRVSQSYVINRNFITSINKKNKTIVLINAQIVPFTVTIRELLTLISTVALT
ncbi:LytTr DNA-binding domain protein [compost metagenome]